MAKAKGHEIDGMSCPDIMSRTIKEFKDSNWTVCKQEAGGRRRKKTNSEQ